MSGRKLLIALVGLAAWWGLAAEPPPREIVKAPVNGTDEIADPVAVKVKLGLTTREACKFVEHGDTLALVDNPQAIASPHVAWARPWGGQPIRVLMFGILNQAAVRTGIELRQRAGFEFTIVPVPSSINDAPPAGSVLVATFYQRFRQALDREYDVIVLPGVEYGAFDPAFAALILAKIRAGTGVVTFNDVGQWFRVPKERLEPWHELVPIDYAYSGGGGPPARTQVDHYITRGISMKTWPDVKLHKATADAGATVLASGGETPFLATGEYGQARVVGFYYFPFVTGGLVPAWDEDSVHHFDDRWEPVYALWLKTIVWAAGKEPATSLQVPEVTETEAGVKLTVPVRLAATAMKAPSGKVRFHLQDSLGHEVDTGTATLDDGLSLTAPAGRGDYRLDLWLMDGGKVIDWGTTVVRVTGGAELTVSPAYQTGVTAPSVSLTATANRSGTLRVSAIDDLGRIFWQGEQPIAGEATIAVPMAASRLPRNRIELALLDGKRVLARAAAEVYLPRLGTASLEDEFCLASYGWTRAEPQLERQVGDLYRLAGLNTIYANWHSRGYVRQVIDSGLFSISGAMSPYLKPSNLEKVLKTCPNDPKVQAEWLKNLGQANLDVRELGGVGRVLDDEAHIAYTQYKDGEMQGAQACQCEHCLADFRQRMTESYGDIARLNAVWGTAFASFSEVRVIEEKEIDANGNPSGWLEFRQYMNWVYANRYYGWIQEQQAALAPSYGVGPGAPFFASREGGPTYRGGDYSMLKPVLRFIMAYGGPENRIFPDAYVGEPGGQKYDPPLYWQQWGPWYQLLNGADALWFYYGSQLVGPELAWRRHAEWLETGIADIRDGAGTLVSRAEPLNRQIRILYSPENLALGWLYGKRTDEWRGLRLEEGRTVTGKTIEKLFTQFFFMQPSYVMADDIRRGDLKDCRLLVLPQALALDDATAAAIRDFVRNGGTVVADVLPATRGQFGQPREAGSGLADVFGVEPGTAGIHTESETWYSIGLLTADDRFSAEGTWLPGNTWMLGVKASGATALGKALSREGKEADAFFLNEFGKGKALLLNFVYRDLDLESSGWHRIFGLGLCRLAGLEPPARIVDPLTGEGLPYRPLYAFRYGAATLLGSIRGHAVWSGGKPLLIDESAAFDQVREARFAWAEPQFAYDVRGRQSLGRVNAAAVSLPSFEGRLLALLPYEVKGVKLTAPARARPGETVTVQAKIETDGEPGRHVFHLEVTSPTGARRPLYCQVRQGDGGQTGFVIPFAFNDPVGDWTLTVRDVLSGVAQKQRVGLK